MPCRLFLHYVIDIGLRRYVFAWVQDYNLGMDMALDKPCLGITDSIHLQGDNTTLFGTAFVAVIPPVIQWSKDIGQKQVLSAETLSIDGDG